MTLKMTTAQVVETSVTVTNSSFQNYTHPDDHTTRTFYFAFIQFPQMKSAFIASIICCLLIAVSSTSNDGNQACYDKCNNVHIKCVEHCAGGNNDFKCLWKCRNDYYGCTAKCYAPERYCPKQLLLNSKSPSQKENSMFSVLL